MPTGELTHYQVYPILEYIAEIEKSIRNGEKT
jgi:hypothetical protein